MDLNILEKKYKSVSRRRKSKNIVLALVGIFLVTGVGLVLFSGFLQLKIFTANGSSIVSDDSIKKEFEEYKKNNISFWQKKSDYLWISVSDFSDFFQKKEPRVAIIGVEKSFPDFLSVRVKDRLPALIMCTEREQVISGCFFVDEKGIVYAQTSQTIGALIPQIFIDEEIEINKKVFEENFVSQFVKLSEGLSREAGIIVKKVQLKFYLVVTTNEGWEIRFEKKSNFSERVSDLKLLLSEQIKEKRSMLSYVDMTISGRAYYKLKGE